MHLTFINVDMYRYLLFHVPDPQVTCLLIISWGDKALVLYCLMHLRDERIDNESVITPSLITERSSLFHNIA